MYRHSLGHCHSHEASKSQCRRTKVTSKASIILHIVLKHGGGRGGKNGPPLNSGSEVRVVASGLTFASTKTPPEEKSCLFLKSILRQTSSSMDDYSKILTCTPTAWNQNLNSKKSKHILQADKTESQIGSSETHHGIGRGLLGAPAGGVCERAVRTHRERIQDRVISAGATRTHSQDEIQDDVNLLPKFAERSSFTESWMSLSAVVSTFQTVFKTLWNIRVLTNRRIATTSNSGLSCGLFTQRFHQSLDWVVGF